jgi:hypothetical protein
MIEQAASDWTMMPLMQVFKYVKRGAESRSFFAITRQRSHDRLAQFNCNMLQFVMNTTVATGGDLPISMPCDRTSCELMGLFAGKSCREGDRIGVLP